MDLTGFAKVLGGARRLEGSGANRPTNVSRTIGTAVADSEDGKVLVRLDAQVFSSDGSQYVELDTSDNVREGDALYVDMVGADGKGKSLMVSGALGSGDRQQGEIESAATTATKYVTEMDDGIMVHPEGDETTGWSIREALELLLSGASMFKVWLEDTVTNVRIGEEEGSHILLRPREFLFRYFGDGWEAVCARITSYWSALVSQTMFDLSGEDERLTITGEVNGMTDRSSVTMAATDTTSNPNTASVSVTSVYDGESYTAEVGFEGDTVTVEGDDLHEADMDNFGRIIRSRVDVTYGTMTIPANSGASATFLWESGGFADANYIASVTPIGMVSGYNNVGYCINGRTETDVTVYAWNNNSYEVSQLIGIMGMDSRYGSETEGGGSETIPMIEWTTPTQEILINSVDVTEATVYVTIAQGAVSMTLTPTSMSYDADSGTTITITLTQEQTGSLHAGTAKLQVNVIDSGGHRDASNQVTLTISSNLLDEEV